MNKKHIIRLSDEERAQLTELTRKGKAAAYKIRHAQILLKADVEGPAWTDAKIAESFSVSVNTVLNVRQRLVEQGLEAALNRKPQAQPSRRPVLDGEREARLIALRCSAPPAGHARWTLRLLADQAVALEIVETISHETVRQALKKRVETASAEDVGHSPRAERGVCRAYGGYLGGLPQAVRSPGPTGVHG
jgi:hypothetical protein